MIQIFCDDASHAARRRLVPVADCLKVEDRQTWDLFGRGVEPQRLTPDDEVWPRVDRDRFTREPLRKVYKLRCRKCQPRAVLVRESRLFAVLDELLVRGESRISLRDLAARLSESPKD